MSFETVRESARVVGVGDGRLWVEARNEGHCGTCSANKSCGHRLLAKALQREPRHLEVLAGESAALDDIKPGDHVDITLAGDTVLKLSLLFYLIPLLAMTFGAGLAHWLGSGEGLVVLTGFVGFALSFFWLKNVDARNGASSACVAVFAGRSREPAHRE